MAKERESKGWVDKYEMFNWATMITSLLLIGGSVGLAIASLDAAQIAIIRYYKKKKREK